MEEPKLQACPKGELKAKGAATQGTRVEEPGRTAHQFLCTKEVGTPKASFNWGKNEDGPTLSSRVQVSGTLELFRFHLELNF